jgi:hypothetical protein
MATSPDVETLERETAAARARLADTLERLTSPQTAQAVKQELTDYATGIKDNVLGTGRSRALDLRDRALANPLGLLMIGAGIGWHLYRHPPVTTLLVGAGVAMLMKGGDGGRAHRRAFHDPYNPVHPASYVPGGVAGYGYPMEEEAPSASIAGRAGHTAANAGYIARDLSARASEAAHQVAERVSQAAETVRTSAVSAIDAARATVSDAAATTRETVMGAADTTSTTISDAAHAARSTTSGMIERGTSALSQARAATVRGAGSAADMAQSNPLLLGVLGVAAGTALMYALRSAGGGNRYAGRRDEDVRQPPRRSGRGVSSRSGAAARAGSRSAGERTPSADQGIGRAAGRVSDTAEGIVSSAADVASSVASTASRALGAAGEAVTSTASGAYEAASSAARSTADLAYSAARRAPRAAGYVQDQVSDLGERYPLLLGAVSIALGAAVGGALRLSEGEQRLMGPMSAKLKERARELAGEQFELAKEAAQHLTGELQTRLGGNGQDRSADFETVLGGGQSPVAGGGQPGASTGPAGRMPTGGTV